MDDSIKILVDLLERAYTSPLGLKIESEDADAMRRRLYVARRRAKEADPAASRYDGLSIVLSPSNDKVLFIIREEKRSELMKGDKIASP